MVIIILNSFLKLIKNDFKAEELKKKTERKSYKLRQGFRQAHRQESRTCPRCCVILECHFVPSIMSRELLLRDLKTILSGHWMRANTQMPKTCSH